MRIFAAKKNVTENVCTTCTENKLTKLIRILKVRKSICSISCVNSIVLIGRTQYVREKSNESVKNMDGTFAR